MSLSPDLSSAIAATRFGLGASPGEIDEIRADPRGYLLAQIRPEGADQPQVVGGAIAERVDQFREYERFRKASAPSSDPKSDPVKAAVRRLRADMDADFLGRIKLAATTKAGFRERWALFWANHFTVSANKLVITTLAGPFEADAIRPHVFGRFEDMLVASSSHPAMLVYLDQAQSIGPNSPAGLNQARSGKVSGLNENLAREILELHTLGVDAGYSQTDVTEFARAMTGWSLGGPKDPDDRQGRFVYRPFAHEPGARVILGQRYLDSEYEQARSVMKTLAASPHTARHLAKKIAIHFVADEPPQTLVDRLAANYLASSGNLAAVARTLVMSPEAWAPEALKFKTPYEFLVSSWRAAGSVPTETSTLIPTLAAMGQRPFSAPSPKGWAEEAPYWCAPDAVIKRLSWSEAFAATTIGERDPLTVARSALGARLAPLTAQSIARAETRGEGLAILLMSPEFQRR